MAENKEKPYDLTHHYGGLKQRGLFSQRLYDLKNDPENCGFRDVFLKIVFTKRGFLIIMEKAKNGEGGMGMKSIKEIREELSAYSLAELPAHLDDYAEDERKGVQNLIASFQKKIKAHEKELQRLDGLLLYERELNKKGLTLVAGVDEVGRGPLAGPVVAAAVILPVECHLEGINDSKKLSAKKREELYDQIMETAVSYGIGVIPSERIDEINILQATFEAMQSALSQLSPAAEFVLADAVTIPKIKTPQRGIVKGDAKSISIGAASIIAKVYRDRIMVDYDKLYPAYAFASNKGYGSKEHMDAIRENGLCPIHRRSFVKNIVSEGAENTRETGRRAEAVAARQMEKAGYRILAKNYFGPHGEIDIVAEKDGYTVFTEVKYRSSEEMGRPIEAVTKRKQEHIIETAKEYIAEYRAEGNFRFDVAEVLSENGQTYFKYTEDAFRPELTEE